MIWRGALLLAGVTAYFLAVIKYATKEYKPMSQFAKDLIERALKTFVQAFAAAIGGGTVFEWSIGGVKAAALAGAAAVLSLVTSIISARFGNPADASLVSAKEA